MSRLPTYFQDAPVLAALPHLPPKIQRGPAVSTWTVNEVKDWAAKSGLSKYVCFVWILRSLLIGLLEIVLNADPVIIPGWIVKQKNTCKKPLLVISIFRMLRGFLKIRNPENFCQILRRQSDGKTLQNVHLMVSTALEASLNKPGKLFYHSIAFSFSCSLLIL